MEDIAPELLKKIQEDFRRDIETSVRIKNVLDKLGAGEATYQDAQVYAEKIGQALARAFKHNLSAEMLPSGRMYYNIAERVLAPMLEESYDEVANVAAKVQQDLNKNAGLGLKAKRAALNEDRIKGLVDRVSNAESFEDVSWILQAPVENFCLNVVDETLKANVEIHAKAGLNPRIIRKAESGCCKWCSQLEGEYLYDGDMPEDVFRRHERCRCLVTYDPADGSNRRQNVHTKKWTTAEELEKRKTTEGVKTDFHIRTVPEKRAPQNVLSEYIREARPGEGEIKYAEGYDFGHHKDEVKMAQWLHDNLGGDIVLLGESRVVGEKTPDYIWRDRLWDLKTISSEKAANSAIRHGIKQISNNPGGIILDSGNNSLAQSTLCEVIDKRMGWYDANGSIDILVLANGKLIAAKRY